MCATLIRFPSFHTHLSAPTTPHAAALSPAALKLWLDTNKARLHCSFKSRVKNRSTKQYVNHSHAEGRTCHLHSWLFVNLLNRKLWQSFANWRTYGVMCTHHHHSAACCSSCLCHTRLSLEWSGMTNHQNNNTLLEHSGWAEEWGLEGAKFTINHTLLHFIANNKLNKY